MTHKPESIDNAVPWTALQHKQLISVLVFQENDKTTLNRLTDLPFISNSKLRGILE